MSGLQEIQVRKLKPEEHGRTRELWERIFTEDTPEFLDYYYSVKTKDNEIYVIEDEGTIVSMLHLNPYAMRVGNRRYKTHYIVAVATDERYRRRGFMAALLNQSMKDMAERGEPFTFLMPAAEDIYLPFGFRYIYRQGRSRVAGVKHPKSGLAIERATGEDCAEIAAFANTCLEKYRVVTWRDACYYKTVLAEQRSENGGILLVRKEGCLVGVLPYAKEETLECREPLFLKREDMEAAIYHLTGNEKESVLCVGYKGEEKKPMIMGRILNEEVFFRCFGSENFPDSEEIFINEVV